MGMGIWAMHYIAMLAFSLPVPVLYHYPTVLISLLAAIVASAVALATVSRERMNAAAYVVGSVIMAGGIASMHYIGMAAMRMPAMMHYRWDLLILSLVLAIASSLVALWLTFRVRHERKASLIKILSALAMGGAIPLMHYTGMWAVEFHTSDAPFRTEHAVHISPVGILAISLTSFLVVLLAIISAFLERLFARHSDAAKAAREGEARLRILAEAIPQIVWTAIPGEGIDYANQRFYDLTGFTEEQTKGSGWQNALHPDDRPVAMANWEKASETGQSFEMEYRIQDQEGGYHWHLVRAAPMRDSNGKIVKWFGACADIEDQKHNLQILEQQIKERTEELGDANTRLQEEMWERDLARRELDQQNEKMMQDLTERSQRATLLAKMGELLQSCVTKDEVFAAALGFAPKIFPTTRGAFALLNAERTIAEIAGAWNECHLSVSVFEPVSCWAMRTGHPHLVVAGDLTAPCAHAAGVKNTYLCIPILAQGESMGILHFQATDDAPTLADSEMSFKTTFAGQVGLSVANIRLREALRAQSIKDPLTGLYNRRYLTEALARETRRAARGQQSVGILMLDLDHFKKFNDTYGHDAGDAVLRETASFLVKSVRAEDIVCRFGGEEFVIILPVADLKASRNRAERIRAKLHDLTVIHEGRSLGMITVSVGLAAFPDHGSDPQLLLEAADAALYRAKNEGRDRVAVAEITAAVDQPPSELGAATSTGK